MNSLHYAGAARWTAQLRPTPTRSLGLALVACSPRCFDSARTPTRRSFASGPKPPSRKRQPQRSSPIPGKVAATNTATKTALPPTGPRPAPAPRPPPGQVLAGNRFLEGPNMPYARALAAKSSPTTLYEASTPRMFLVSSYGAGFALMGSAAVNAILNINYLPPGAPVWAPYAFGFTSFCMAVMGTYFSLMPASIIASIRVLPSKPTTAAPPDPKAAAAAAKTKTADTTAAASSTQPAPVRIELLIRRALPFIPLKRVEIDPSELLLKQRLYHPPPPPPTSPSASPEARRAAADAARQYELDHLMSAPFRHAGTHINTLYGAIRRGLTGEAFAPILVKGVRCKLDLASGYALDGGRALDRVCAVEEEEVPPTPTPTPTTRR